MLSSPSSSCAQAPPARSRSPLWRRWRSTGASRSVALATICSAGIDQAIVQYFHTADIWVVNGDDIFNTSCIRGRVARRRSIAERPVWPLCGLPRRSARCRCTRRLWLRARPATDRTMIEASQVVQRQRSPRATQLIRGGGWAAVSSGFASEHHLRVGSSFTLPTPSGPVRFGVAAITTNSGWPPGAITINSNDYRRDWRTSERHRPGGEPQSGVGRSGRQACGAGRTWSRSGLLRALAQNARAKPRPALVRDCRASSDIDAAADRRRRSRSPRR